MKVDTNNNAALKIIGNLVVQAAAKGDTVGMLEHLEVYIAVVKTTKRQAAKGRG